MGRQETTRDAPSHSTGNRKGEELGNKFSTGWEGDTRTARDATSINADKRGPIDPRMPQMPPP
ncbi:MAG: hypothetical protein ABI383_13435 [Acidobacteriaceae bacterium]